MVTFVLDASALLRFLDNESGAERVRQILHAHVAQSARVVLSAIHWGEVAGVLYKRSGLEDVDQVVSRLRELKIDIVPATAESAARSAIIKADRKIPYADAFGVELAQTLDAVLVTSDFDLKPAEHDVAIEFLPAKPR